MISHKTRWTTSSAEKILAKSSNRLPTFNRYCLDVLTGNIPTGRLVFLAVERHLADLETGHTRGLHFDQDAAGRVIRFFRDCSPFKLEPFQQFLAGSLHGWKTLDGFRRFRTAYIEIGKGNGKSPFGAGLALFALSADREPNAEVYCAATTKEQAKIAFRDAVIMRDGSKALSKRIAKYRDNFSIGHSYFRPISSEHRGLDGKRPHFVLIDEVHEHPTSLVVDKMRAGTKGRRQPLIVLITNSGYDRETVCWYQHEYSQRILEGTLENDEHFAYVCHLDACEACQQKGHVQPNSDCADCDNWLDEDTWIKPNPGLGVIIQKKYLQGLVTEAVAMPAKENITRRLNFCMWTQNETRAISAQAWAACSGDAPDAVAWRQKQLDELKGLTAYGGFDLGCTDDLTAWVIYFPKQKQLAKDRLLAWFYAPQASVPHRVNKDRIPYDLWQRTGFLTVTPGNTTDYQYIREDIKRSFRDYCVKEIRFDRYRAIETSNQLLADGLPLVDHPMGLSMHDPTNAVLAMVRDASFEHGNNPLLTFCALNLVTIQDAKGNINMKKPESQNSPFKIDGMVAFALAKAAASANPCAGDGGVAVMDSCCKCGELCLGKDVGNGTYIFDCGKHAKQ